MSFSLPPPSRSSSSNSGRLTKGWTESQQRTSSSSSYSTPTPPLFPSPLFLSAHQSHYSYPPGYQSATPIWTVPNPQGMPIPTLCSSSTASSIPSLIPNDWYRHQRKRKERYIEERRVSFIILCLSARLLTGENILSHVKVAFLSCVSKEM